MFAADGSTTLFETRDALYGGAATTAAIDSHSIERKKRPTPDDGIEMLESPQLSGVRVSGIESDDGFSDDSRCFSDVNLSQDESLDYRTSSPSSTEPLLCEAGTDDKSSDRRDKSISVSITADDDDDDVFFNCDTDDKRDSFKSDSNVGDDQVENLMVPQLPVSRDSVNSISFESFEPSFSTVTDDSTNQKPICSRRRQSIMKVCNRWNISMADAMEIMGTVDVANKSTPGW